MKQDLSENTQEASSASQEDIDLGLQSYRHKSGLQSTAASTAIALSAALIIMGMGVVMTLCYVLAQGQKIPNAA